MIPKRFGEGYGLSMAAYERVKLLEPDLIITVDCGISCADEVEHILADGVKVVITDHHEAGDSVPKGFRCVIRRYLPTIRARSLLV